MTRYQAPTQRGHMLSRAAGACLPTDASINQVNLPSNANAEATHSWFDGRNLPAKREHQAVIT